MQFHPAECVGAQFRSCSWQAAIGRVRSADRSNLWVHVSRTVADTVSNSYGSEGLGFDSLASIGPSPFPGAASSLVR